MFDLDLSTILSRPPRSFKRSASPWPPFVAMVAIAAVAYLVSHSL